MELPFDVPSAWGECSQTYYKGVIHGVLLMLPVALFLYRKWYQHYDLDTAKKPQLGDNFLRELFQYEVVLTAGAELKAVKDQLEEAEKEGNEQRISAVQERMVDVALVLEKQLQAVAPIVEFLSKQSVETLQSYKDSHNESIESDKDK